MKPIAWMFRGYFYDTDPSDWTIHEHPDVPVIPLYTHPVKELTDDEIVDIGTEFLAPKDCDIYTFARAILRKAQEK